jgi:hypothetical protein
MAEYVLAPDDIPQEVAAALLAEAGEARASEVTWSPRPDTPHGGVYVVPDDVATKVLTARTKAKATADAAAAKQRAADKTKADAVSAAAAKAAAKDEGAPGSGA